MSKILVIGETCLDQNIYVETVKINPECPSLVVRPIGETQVEGMAANVYNNLVSLGISKSSILTIFPYVDIVKKRIIEKSSNYTLLRIDEDDGIIEKYKSQFKRADFDDVIEQVGIVVISSYNKNFLTIDDIKYISDECRKRNVKIFYDGKFILGGWSKDIYCVKINRAEYQDQLKAGIKPEDRCVNLITTRGADGTVFNGKTYPTGKVINPSPCGCGDCVLAALVYGFYKGWDFEKSIPFANKVGQVAASKPGTVTVSQQEVMDLA
jgi:bifunctional ADP-heptose synthase (sugar kinase/adenylyltransferase)